MAYHREVYLDNGATSFPKAPGVGEAMARFITEVGVNVGRGGYARAYDAAGSVLDIREKLCRLVGAPSPRNIIFTGGATAALNTLLKGLLRPGDQVLTTPMEHNAVARPLEQLRRAGVAVHRLPCDSRGQLDLAAAEEAIGPHLRAVVMTHASNVCGTILPIARVGALCRRHGVFFLVDGAQSAGVLPLHMGEMGIDGLAFPAHKGLLGPQGLGVMAVTDSLAAALDPLIAGGTGSLSHSLDMPGQLPDRFEAGTLNLPGIFGLGAALDYLEERGIPAIRSHEEKVTGHLMARMAELEEDGVALIGTERAGERTAIVSLDFPGRDNGEAAAYLARRGVACRSGLHCAPLAHAALGTFPRGTVRLSPGPFSTFEEMDYVQAVVMEFLAKSPL